MAVTDRRYRKTESQIENAMLDLLQKRPFEEILVVDVVNQADINRSTFYLHYQSLSDVLGALEDRCISLLSPLGTPHSQKDSIQLATSLYDLLESNLPLFKGVLLSAGPRFDEKLRDLFFPSLGITPPPKNKKTSDDRSVRGGSLISGVRTLFTLYFEGNACLEVKKLLTDVIDVIDSPLYRGILPNS